MQWVLHSKTSHVRIAEYHEKVRMGNNSFLPAQEFQKMTYWDWRNRGRWLTGNSEIKEDDRGLADSGFWQGGIGQAPVSHLPWFDGAVKSSCYIWKWIWWNQLPKVIFRDKRFRLVASRNCLSPGKSSSGDWKIVEIVFGWTKSSQKSSQPFLALSRHLSPKYNFYAPY